MDCCGIVAQRSKTVKSFLSDLGCYKQGKSFRAKQEAKLAIFEAEKSTLLAVYGDEKIPSLKSF